VRRFWGGECGTTVIEFALVAPLFLILIFGTIEFGRLIWTKEALQEAAVAGARCVAIAQGAVPGGPCTSGGSYSSAQAISYVQTEAGKWGISVPSAAVTPTASTSCAGTGGFSEVSISTTYTSLVPKFTQLPGTITLNASACYPSNT
jgi:Flp pilus assembly protein TadG